MGKRLDVVVDRGFADASANIGAEGFRDVEGCDTDDGNVL